jgi:hypothetical protein
MTEGRSVVASVTEDRESTEAEAGRLPIDMETISETVDLAWDMSLSTSTREVIDRTTLELIGHLNLLRGQPLGEDENRDAAQILRVVERHLSRTNRPSSRAHAHEAFEYMRDSAIFTKTLLSIYEKANEKR